MPAKQTEEGQQNQDSNPWDELIKGGRVLVDSGRLQLDEIDYKLEIAQRLSMARKAVLEGSENWADLVKAGLPNRPGSPLSWQLADSFRKWLEASPYEALEALRTLWTGEGDDADVIERIASFSDRLPSSISGPGTRANAASVLLMGLDVKNFPPFRFRAFNRAYKLTGYSQAKWGAAEYYEHALGFLDQLIREASQRGLELRHRLDAQGLVWQSQYDDSFWNVAESVEQYPSISGPVRAEPDLDELAEELFLTEPPDFLHEIETLLADKKQVIFQGPPGTGKTYVAQQLANHLAGSKDRVTLVQFHPSYAYEDSYAASVLRCRTGRQASS